MENQGQTTQSIVQYQNNSNQIIRLNFDTLSGFEAMQRAAKLLAASTIVPKDYQGNISNCVIAINMASRIGMDPLMVMQNLYMVNGRPAWSSQFLIAALNSCGKYQSIGYTFSGKENTDAWGCEAYAIEKASKEKLVGTKITIAMAKSEGWYAKNGSKWQSMPEQMLRYRAAAFFVRAYAPEIAMGIHTQEEIEDITAFEGSKDVTPKSKAEIVIEAVEVSKAEQIKQKIKKEVVPVEEPAKKPAIEDNFEAEYGKEPGSDG